MDDARIFHVNVNCSDLERSRAFYARALGLDPVVRTTPDAVQPGAAFGLSRAWWDAWILVGGRGFDGGAIDLLEWREPRPAGAPPRSLVECGYQRVGIAVADLDAVLEEVTVTGGTVWSVPASHELTGGGRVRLVMANDPDGTAIELIEGEAGPRLAFVAVCCADLEYSHAFYRALGFEERARYASDNADGSHLHVDGPVAMDEIMLSAPAGGDVGLVLVGWRVPAHRTGTERPANTLGIWRTALVVADLDEACARLAALQIPTLAPIVAMAMGDGLPVLRFVCFRGPDGEVIELIEQPR
jgi:catechol 2,3-dioxygenase-like lactoylglutathione lyase family enzyme